MIGANRRDDACRVSNQLVLVVSGVALAIMVPVLAFRQQLLSLMFQQVEPDVMSNALTYLEITAISYPFIAIYNAGTALYRSMNRSNPPPINRSCSTSGVIPMNSMNSTHGI